MSFSTLSKSEKSWLKLALIRLVKNGGEITHFENVTAVFEPDHEGAQFGKFAVSFRSPAEFVNRRDVGKFHALQKLNHGEFIKIPNYVDTFFKLTERLAD